MALFIEITAVLLALMVLTQLRPVAPDVSLVIVIVVAPAVFKAMVLNDPVPAEVTVIATVLLVTALGALRL